MSENEVVIFLLILNMFLMIVAIIVMIESGKGKKDSFNTLNNENFLFKSENKEEVLRTPENTNRPKTSKVYNPSKDTDAIMSGKIVDPFD